MVLTVLAIMLILGLAFYQVLQGLFSALIQAVIAVISALAALSLYGPLAEMLHSSRPAYADMVALSVLFVVLMAGLRLLADWLIPDNVVFDLWPNRIGAGVLGLLSGVVIAGMLAVAIQMLPLGASALGYRPFDESLRRSATLSPFRPDDFVVGLARRVTSGALRSEGSFADKHDDLLLELFCARNTADAHGRVDASPESLIACEVYAPAAPVGAEPATDQAVDWKDAVPKNPLLSEAALTKVFVVRAAVAEDARDTDDWWRLPGTHFRLVGRSGRSYYPVGCLTYFAWKKERSRLVAGEERWRFHGPAMAGGRAQVAGLLVARSWRRGVTSLNVDWVYRLLEDDAPAYMVFRRVSTKVARDPKPHMPPTEHKDKRLALERVE